MTTATKAGIHEEPTSPGSVAGVPNLPDGFKETFRSHVVPTGKLKLHAVTGGEGPALLLLGGWPQTWYAWRFIMPELAKNFSVVAVDPRGVGLSDKPETGYDSGTLTKDLIDLMLVLDHKRFAMVGHDIGMWTGYAMAVDFPGRIERLAVAEAIIPGISPSPSLLPEDRWLSDFLWHFNFNRALHVNEQLVQGREEIYFGHQFASKAATPQSIPAYAVKVYVDALKASPAALRASFDYYRAIDVTFKQNQGRKKTKLRLPVLAIAGAAACGDSVRKEMKLVADDVNSVVIPDCGHFVPEEKPHQLLEALADFLTPFRAGFARGA